MWQLFDVQVIGHYSFEAQWAKILPKQKSDKFPPPPPRTPAFQCIDFQLKNNKCKFCIWLENFNFENFNFEGNKICDICWVELKLAATIILDISLLQFICQSLRDSGTDSAGLFLSILLQCTYRTWALKAKDTKPLPTIPLWHWSTLQNVIT